MKKICAAACGIMMLGLVACGGDNPSKDPTDNPTRQQAEGEYCPAVKIEYTQLDEVPTEIWGWTGDKLMFVGTPDQCGGYTETTLFSYDGSRVSAVEKVADSIAVHVSYSGKYITAFTLMYAGVEGATVAVEHNADNKIGRMAVEVNEVLLQQLVNRLLSDGELFSRHPLVRLLGEPVARTLVRVASLREASRTKVGFDNVAATIELDWTGENVTQVRVAAEVAARVTMAEVAQVVDLEEYLGSLADLAATLPGEHPLTAVVSDTVYYTYDDHANPLRGYMGEVDVAMLSANNVLTADNYGTADLTLTLSIPIVGEHPVSQSIPLSQTSSWNYTYTEAGYPARVTNDEGEVKEYFYEE